MSRNIQRRNDEPLSEQSRYFVLQMVERYMQMSRQEQEAHLKQVEKRLQYFAQQRKKNQETNSTQRTSSISFSDHNSPAHFKKTTSLITEEKVGEFRTQPQTKPKIHSQHKIKQSKEESESKPKIADYSFVSQQYDLSKLQGNQQNFYLIPEKYDTPEKQKAFYKKVIRPLKFLGIPGDRQNYKRAMESRAKIKHEYPNNFKEVQGLGLFYMDLVTEIGRARDLGIKYVGQLKELNKLLMFKIEIGMKTERKKLLKVFEIHWQSLVEIILQRIWSEDSEKEHGLDFFTCKDNLKKIKKITLLGNYLTKKFYESLKQIKLPQLQVLEMNFEQQVDHKELFRIFQVISAYNEKFEIHLVTCLKNKNELPPFLTQNYGQRIYLIDRTKKPSQKLQNQRPVEKIKYQKPAYQIAHQTKEKLGPKPVYTPKNPKKSNIDPNIPLQNVPLIQGISNVQPLSNQGLNNIIPTQQVQGLSNPIQPIANPTVLAQHQQISGIGIYADHQSSIQGIKIGNTQINQKTQHHHHTQIHHQTTQRIIQNHHYQTDTESRSGRSNYGGSRSQYNGGRRGGNYYIDSQSSDDEPYYNNYNNGYSYRGKNNYNYKKKYYNNNRYNGYYKKWYEDDY